MRKKKGAGVFSEMKRLRVPYVIVMAASLFAGLLTGMRVYFLIFYVQLFLLVFCIAVIVYTVASFAYLQTISQEEAVKGDTVHLHLEIHNEKPYPFTMMQVHVQAVSSRENRVLSFHLAPKASISFDLPVACQWRGETGIGMSVVELRDMFGLVHIYFPLNFLPYYRPRRLLVFPKAEKVSLSMVGNPRRLQVRGALTQPSDSGNDLYGLQDYRPGDTDRQIHWKVSAAHNALYTKWYEREARPQCIILIDDCMPFSGEEGKVAADLLCCTAASLSRWALSHQNGVLLCAGSPHIPKVQGESFQDYSMIQQWLALLPFEGQGGMSGENISSELAGGFAAGLPVYLLTASPSLLANVMNVIIQRGAQMVCIWAAMSPGERPSFPDGVLDIPMEPGCNIGTRLGERL